VPDGQIQPVSLTERFTEIAVNNADLTVANALGSVERRKRRPGGSHLEAFAWSVRA
jgi:hypothetical protein